MTSKLALVLAAGVIIFLQFTVMSVMRDLFTSLLLVAIGFAGGWLSK